MNAMRAPEAISDRKADRRTEAFDLRLELAVQRSEEITFIRRVHGDANRVIRLIEGGLLAEAHSTLGGLVHATNRREAQVLAPDEDAA